MKHHIERSAEHEVGCGYMQGFIGIITSANNMAPGSVDYGTGYMKTDPNMVLVTHL